MQSVDEKDQRIKQLENENQKLQEKIDRLEHNVEALTQAVLHASKQRFGASSEKRRQQRGKPPYLAKNIKITFFYPMRPSFISRNTKDPYEKRVTGRN